MGVSLVAGDKHLDFMIPRLEEAVGELREIPVGDDDGTDGKDILTRDVAAVEPYGFFFCHKFLVFGFVIGAFGAANGHQNTVHGTHIFFLFEGCAGHPACGGLFEGAFADDFSCGFVLVYEKFFTEGEVLEASYPA